MATESMSERYEKALQLAETGRHAEALECIRQHLEGCPNDEQGFNDAGAILFCMGRIDEAIEYFEKARSLCTGSVSGEILWNLCQAYLDGGYPAQAAKLFEDMKAIEILNPDVINRTANEFLKQESFGNAIEMLLASLEMTPGQEVLEPMLEVIRSKRAKLAVYSFQENDRVKRFSNYASKRFVCELYIGDAPMYMRDVMDTADILWIEGCDDTAVEITRMPKNCRIVLSLSANEVSEPRLNEIDWNNVDMTVLAGTSFSKDLLVDTVPDIESLTRLVTINHAVDVNRIRFIGRNRGKNLAHIISDDSVQNTIFLLQCMQKLNYIDSAYRLYIAGEFTKSTDKQYMDYMIDRLRLSGVVFFDRNVTSIESWLRDKHYIVSTRIDGGDLTGVLTAMACGLKPVVHSFPGVDEIITEEFVFDIAEQFCGQITSEDYQPRRYREMVESTNSQKLLNSRLNDILFKLEKDPVKKTDAQWNRPVAADQLTPADHDQSSFTEFPQDVFEPIQVNVPKTIPITPAQTSDFDITADDTGFDTTISVPIETNWNQTPVKDIHIPQKDYFRMGAEGTIDKLAKEALEASQTLADMAQNDKVDLNPSMPQSSVPPIEGAFSDEIQLPRGGYSSLDAMTRDQKISRVANEFTDDIGPIDNSELNIAGAHQIPFTG